MTHPHSGGPRRRLLASAVIASAIIAVAIWAELLLAARGGPGFVFLASSLGIAATAWLAGFAAALAAIAATAIAADFFVLGRGVWFDVGGPLATGTFALFVAGWIGVSWLVRTARARSSREIGWRIEAERAAGHSARLVDLTGAFARART